MSAARPSAVPIAASGLEGWSSCCEAAVTYSIALGDPVLCCKACWGEVVPVPLSGEPARALDAVVRAVIDGHITPDEAVLRQRDIILEARHA